MYTLYRETPVRSDKQGRSAGIGPTTTRFTGQTRFWHGFHAISPKSFNENSRRHKDHLCSLMRFRKAEKTAGKRGVKEEGWKKKKNPFYHFPAAETITVIHRRTHVCFSFIFFHFPIDGVQDAFYWASITIKHRTSTLYSYIDEYNRLEKKQRYRRKQLDTPSVLVDTGFFRFHCDRRFSSENTFLFLFVLLLARHTNTSKTKTSNFISKTQVVFLLSPHRTPPEDRVPLR